MQNQFEFTLSYFKCTVILPRNCYKFTLAGNERCARTLTDNIHQAWQGLGVYSFEGLSLKSVLFFAKQLQSFLACRFFSCHILLPFKCHMEENPRPLQPGFTLLMLNGETTEPTVCMAGQQNPTMIGSVSLTCQYHSHRSWLNPPFC